MSIKIGKASFWHVHAWDYTKQAQQHQDTVIAAVWDEDPERGRKAAEQLNVPYFEEFADMLAVEGLDAIIVDAPTNIHQKLIIAAAQAGKHIFTEKVIAPTVQEVNDIIKEVDNSSVKLTVSLPRLNDGYTQAIQKVLHEGHLGVITYVRVRLSHNGAIAGWLPDHFFNLKQCGGGALIDLGCHPMYLTRLFLDQPVTAVSANFGHITGKEVEDNAVATLYTESGAIGIVEAGFVNSHSPFSIEVHGTEGTLLYGTPEEKILLRSNKAADSGAGWLEVPIPENRESSFDQWVSHIQQNTLAVENIEIAVELTRLIEAANRSASEGNVISI
ncbi:Gfo/Idh/MocA family protein [Paenibacillus endoradicis]|uniref:Gfo/Idh/MocA family protein n=1 Tax=Paenibacillus endoradicis TaxID=2972487 RepID=UPI0021590DE5|nr:Gfo/Idh/MocA family oxidoreductase [Paenibacillus endoradicis]MCR8657034.1 Gfo/Idh/MocA family oxidoreductase [Paenibacillus endoradicis]